MGLLVRYDRDRVVGLLIDPTTGQPLPDAHPLIFPDGYYVDDNVIFDPRGREIARDGTTLAEPDVCEFPDGGFFLQEP